jgi:hypothetical protein
MASFREQDAPGFINYSLQTPQKRRDSSASLLSPFHHLTPCFKKRRRQCPTVSRVVWRRRANLNIVNPLDDEQDNRRPARQRLSCGSPSCPSFELFSLLIADR